MEHHHKNSQKIINRLSRVIGHLEGIKAMVENGRDCSEVLTQIAAAKSAINNIGREILKEHISHCVVDAVHSGDEQVIADLNTAIDRFIK